jgi:hypothetical protein
LEFPAGHGNTVTSGTPKAKADYYYRQAAGAFASSACLSRGLNFAFLRDCI